MSLFCPRVSSLCGFVAFELFGWLLSSPRGRGMGGWLSVDVYVHVKSYLGLYVGGGGSIARTAQRAQPIVRTSTLC